MYNLLLVEIFIMYECTLLRIKYSMCGDMIPTHTQTRAGTGAYHRSVPAQISCKIRGEGRSKIKHLYFWLMLFWFWSLLSTFPAHGGCINGVPLHMTIWPAMWRHQTTPLKLQWCTVLGRGPHHPPPTTHHPDPDLPPACTPLLSWALVLLLLLPAVDIFVDIRVDI